MESPPVGEGFSSGKQRNPPRASSKNETCSSCAQKKHLLSILSRELDVLATRKRAGEGVGEVLLNGEPRGSLFQFRKMCGYVEQFDPPCEYATYAFDATFVLYTVLSTVLSFES